MLIDRNLVLSDAQVVASTEDSDNIIDLAVANPNIGKGKGTSLICDVSVAFVSAGGATLVVELVQCDTVGGSYTVLLRSIAGLVAADLVKGYRIFSVGFPNNVQQFVKLVYTVGTSTFSAGKINAFIMNEIPD